MKKHEVKAIELTGGESAIVILELPKFGLDINRIKIFEDNVSGFEELYLKHKPETFEEAIKRVKKVMAIKTERAQVEMPDSFYDLPYRKVLKIEEAFDEKISEAWES